MTTLHDVSDPARCVFCGSGNLSWLEGGWADCQDCTASLRFRRGQVVDDEPPRDLKAVSDLLHTLRSA